MTDLERLRSIADWLGTAWTPEQEDRLTRFVEYLSGEGIDGGGLGPHEAERMVDRHVGDGLVYLKAIGPDRHSVIDIGSGVGLPGIPLAIGRPDLDITLLDRSQRKTDLAGRAVRILGLDNVSVVIGDVSDVNGSWDAVVFRASLGPYEAAEAFQQVASLAGIGVLGVSRLPDTPSVPEPPPGIRFELGEEAAGVLDSPAWVLRMTHL